jgi:hypothetical protein
MGIRRSLLCVTLASRRASPKLGSAKFRHKGVTQASERHGARSTELEPLQSVAQASHARHTPPQKRHATVPRASQQRHIAAAECREWRRASTTDPLTQMRRGKFRGHLLAEESHGRRRANDRSTAEVNAAGNKQVARRAERARGRRGAGGVGVWCNGPPAAVRAAANGLRGSAAQRAWSDLDEPRGRAARMDEPRCRTLSKHAEPWRPLATIGDHWPPRRAPPISDQPRRVAARERRVGTL